MLTEAGKYLIAHKQGEANKVDTSKVKTVKIDGEVMSQFPDGSLVHKLNGGELIEVDVIK
jgi:hypothetical protein